MALNLPTSATAALPPAQDTGTSPDRDNKKRKRARKACLCCRARKVRCDVTQNGSPCMNCFLDGEQCVVTERLAKYRSAQNNWKEATATADAGYDISMMPGSEVQTSQAVVISGMEKVPVNEMLDIHQPPLPAALDVHSIAGGDHESWLDPCESHALYSLEQLQDGRSAVQNKGLTDQLRFDATVIYSHFSFLTMNKLSTISSQDVNFLDAQGCLRVPAKALSDDFLSAYCLHVHPLMPLLNEGDIWATYLQDQGDSQGCLSLLVFQAILFASCNFVSLTTIHALGYSSAREARASFYRRAKLLHDFEAEASPLALAQASLLLSYWSPKSTKRPSTSWLSLAIQHARNAEAHRYATRSDPAPAAGSPADRKLNSLKRIWWCCIVRDRLLGLITRRPIQVARSHFNIDKYPALSHFDLIDEVGRSRVYTPDTKRELIDIMVHLVRFCIILTDVLTLAFPLNDTRDSGYSSTSSNEKRLYNSQECLKRWYGVVMPRLQQHNDNPRHNSVSLYSHLMKIYYYSAEMALCHCEIHSLTSYPSRLERDIMGPGMQSTLRQIQRALQESTSGIIECLKELVYRELAHWLPISAVGCTALPLVLQILDVALAPPECNSRIDGSMVSARKEHRLNILLQAMKSFKLHYDEADWVKEIVRHAVKLAPVGKMGQWLPTSMKPFENWTSMLVSEPRSYLRLVLAIDLSLSKGRLSQESDFPTRLRGESLAVHSSPVRKAISVKAPTGIRDGEAADPEAIMSPQVGGPQYFMTEAPDYERLVDADSITSRAYKHPAEQPITAALAASSSLPSPGYYSIGDAGTDRIFQLEDVNDTSATSSWTEESWRDISDKEERSDRDTAIALLEALEEYGSAEAPNPVYK
ncbi:unnamed protein product [Clonostachys byssicola]|uniref:Zn(2)-C6 fungal-type domain-containing protein n=1 Tax=Clonostachys byssicola TaxID=160290 RepID=A0A9N9XVV9_9HYPO|nr:unnamed protein product [Clonostachys byssicola]